MPRWRPVLCWTTVLLLASLAVAPLGGVEARGEERERLHDLLAVFSEVLQLIQRAYVEEVPPDLLFTGALDGLTDALDPLATYVPRAEVESFRRAREVGLARSGVSLARERGIAYVLAIEPGSPAAAAGLVRGDIIAEIDGDSTREMPLWFLQQRLAAAPGTTLELELLRLGESLDAELRLEEYPPPRPVLERHAEIPVLGPGRIERTAIEPVGRLLDELSAAGEDSLILDLRGTAGGDPASAYAVGALFAQGELGRLRNRRESLEIYDDPSPPHWSGRLLVLIDRSSQGAAEILARILEQAAGAELVGERTFGHAGRQTVRELSNGDQLVLTDAFYTGPDGDIIDRGLEPLLVVSETSRTFEEADVPIGDLILERALERLHAEDTTARGGARS